MVLNRAKYHIIHHYHGYCSIKPKSSHIFFPAPSTTSLMNFSHTLVNILLILCLERFWLLISFLTLQKHLEAGVLQVKYCPSSEILSFKWNIVLQVTYCEIFENCPRSKRVGFCVLTLSGHNSRVYSWEFSKIFRVF